MNSCCIILLALFNVIYGLPINNTNILDAKESTSFASRNIVIIIIVCCIVGFTFIGFLMHLCQKYKDKKIQHKEMQCVKSIPYN